jgi:nucleotide-binding universal stress UspA family protein
VEEADVGAGQQRPIVVGVDGSAAADAAVAWSAEQAREQGRELVLLHATEGGRPTAFPAVPPSDRDGASLPHAAAIGDTATLSVQHRAIDAPAAKALVSASDEAVMLVLGRPRGRLRSWPGPASLTSRVLAGSRCPVVLVPERLEARP